MIKANITSFREAINYCKNSTKTKTKKSRNDDKGLNKENKSEGCVGTKKKNAKRVNDYMNKIKGVKNFKMK